MGEHVAKLFEIFDSKLPMENEEDKIFKLKSKADYAR